MQRPEFLAGVGLLSQFDFTFDLCIRADQLPATGELVRRLPEVQFILDHCGKPPIKSGQSKAWAAGLQTLASLPNVACKISGLTTEADWNRWQANDLKYYFDCVLQNFGFDRVLFGSDWPVATLATTYERWLSVVAEFFSFATENERSKLFQLNAEKIYHV
jgi:L-fuconolactonase